MTDFPLKHATEIEMLKAILGNAPDAIYITSESGHILNVFGGNERTFALEYSTIIGKHFSDVFSARYSRLIEEVIGCALAENRAQYLTHCISPQDILFLEQDTSGMSDTIYWFEARLRQSH